MTTISPLGALLGGVLTLFAPCSVMVLPTFFAYAFTSRRTLLTRTVVFWAGLLTTLVPLGTAIASLGLLLRQWSGVITWVAALVVIALGVAQVFAVEVPRPRLRTRAVGTAVAAPTGTGPKDEGAASSLSVYLLGLTYGFAGVGCAGPILGAVLALAGIGGSPLAGAGLMVLYATGMALPLGLLALVWHWLRLSERPWMRPRPLELLGRWTTWTNVVSGTLFILLGIALVVFGAHNPLGALVDQSVLAAWESDILTATAAIPWWVLLGAAGLLAGALALVWPRRKDGE
ncbi:cytochrome c biogenesis protein CcdA [Schaalia sp. 19OD2882]|uniref:cytochrome c biogenesis CcdA family protein n=1 Tax=Schaalia sp. 19OD2882 TaxID=2794089 RepID=UPI001C1F0FF7|nr:cytochrome c biogenesis CcdA family protein [Schaalia sp. 19OD2882]QWW19209.1 cytochrome c biogenesis protein CcdA [Schaalia sp. 19OD2882]